MTDQEQELREWSAGHENEMISHHIEISRTAYHKGLHRGLEERAKEVADLEALVREAVRLIRDDLLDTADAHNFINRPEVVKIMEGE